MKLIIASNNKGKIREIKEILGSHFEEIMSMREAGIELEVEEDGTTFTENARKKALAALELVQGEDVAVLADDSGLEVDVLCGAPGVYSARYAEEADHDDEANNRKLLNELKDVPESKRTADFACAMVLARRDKPCLEAVGKCYGFILHEPRGEGGFGYDPLFYYPDFQASFGELSPEQKNEVSHRRLALELLCQKIEDEKNM